METEIETIEEATEETSETVINLKRPEPISNVGVFFDYENIVYSLKNRFEQKANFEALMEKCGEFGQIVEARAFADWSMPYMSSALMYALQSAGFDLIFVPTGSTQANAPRKNVADLYMVIQVMEVLHMRPEVDTFVLLTGDRDFMPLVNVLKRNGKRVVAIGVDGSSSYYLTQSVDDFFYYSEVEAIFEEQPKRLKGRPVNIYDALVQAIQFLNERGKASRLTNLKQVMIELMGGFDEKQHNDAHGKPFAKFKDFVLEAQRRGIVIIDKVGAHTEVNMAKGQSGPKKSSRRDSNRTNGRDSSRSNGKSKSSSKASDKAAPASTSGMGIQAAFVLLVQAVKSAEAEKKSFRASSIKARIKRSNADFDERKLADGSGKSFEKFGDFARAAAEQELVVISGTGVKMEIRPGASAESIPEATEEAKPAAKIAEGQLSDSLARTGVVAAIRTFSNYPTSFLSLANHCQRAIEAAGGGIEESRIRDYLTEAVKIDLIHKSKKPDGRTQYELNDQEAFATEFIEAAEEGEASADGEGSTKTILSLTNNAIELEDESPALKALQKVVGTLVDGGNDTFLTRVKSGVLEMMPEFNETDYANVNGNPFLKFKDFVKEAERRGLVRLESKGTVNRVFLPEATDADDADDSAESTEPDATPDADAATFVEFNEVPDDEQRQLILDGLRSYPDFPAPFMGILAHIRKIRDEREIFLPNVPLRELLSESSRVGMIYATTEKGERPTRYAYKEDETLIKQYFGVEMPAEEVEAEETPAVAEEAPVVVKKKPAKPVAPLPDFSPESEVRPAIVAAMQSFADYPAPFKAVENHCKAALSEAKLNVPTKRLKELVSEATRSAVLVMTTAYGVRPKKYALTTEAAILDTYANPAPAEPEPQAEPEPAAAAGSESAPAVDDVYTTLATATAELLASGKKANFRNVKKQMKQHIPDFDEKKVESPNGKTYRKFKDFAKEAQNRVLVILGLDGKTDVLSLPASAEPEAEQAAPEQPAAEAVPEATEAPAEEVATEEAPAAEEEAPAEPEANPLDDAYAQLAGAVAAAVAEGKSTGARALGARLKKLEPVLDAKSLIKADGKKFKSLNEFLVSAEAAGKIKTEGEGNKLKALPLD